MSHQHDFSRGPEAIPAEQQFINKTQLARAVGVTPRTIDNWVRQKWIPSIPISTRCRRFILSEVLAVLRRSETEAVDRSAAPGAGPQVEKAVKGGRP